MKYRMQTPATLIAFALGALTGAALMVLRKKEEAKAAPLPVSPALPMIEPGLSWPPERTWYVPPEYWPTTVPAFPTESPYRITSALEE